METGGGGGRRDEEEGWLGRRDGKMLDRRAGGRRQERGVGNTHTQTHTHHEEITLLF